MEKTQEAVITVVGKDTVGIIARVCTCLAGHGVNILDISQTIVHGYFNMMMVVDISGMDLSFAGLKEELDRTGEQIGVEIHCQKEEIFTKMHRI